jgi:phospholipid transport system substrate-binding protein
MKSHSIAIAILTLAAIRPAFADADANATIDSLDNGLLDIMKNADKLGYKGRYESIAPVIDKVYDLPLMAQISVGPLQWKTLTPEQQAKIIDAFRSLSIATYASRFDGYGGEQFQITGQSPTGGDQVVDTKLIRPNDDPVELDYRLRKNGGDWKIIDVFLSGTISQLANYRSEFATTLREKGADGLVDLINGKVAGLAPKS